MLCDTIFATFFKEGNRISVGGTVMKTVLLTAEYRFYGFTYYFGKAFDRCS